MVSVTLAVPKELKEKMDVFSEINWSEVARKAIAKKISDLEFMDHFTKDSTMTELDAVKWGRELNQKLAKHYKEK